MDVSIIKCELAILLVMAMGRIQSVVLFLNWLFLYLLIENTFILKLLIQSLEK